MTTTTMETTHAAERLNAEVRARIERAAKAERPPDHDSHVHEWQHAQALLRNAAQIAAVFGRLPPTLEQLTPPPADVTRESAEEAHERKLRQRRDRFERQCPPLFREPWNWDLVKPEVKAPEVHKVFGWEYGSRGLYVAGESGHGKTRAMFILVRRLIVQDGRDVLCMDGTAFSNLCTRAFGAPAETEALLAPLWRAEVLVIDDLAKRWTPATEEGCFMVLDRRTAAGLPFLTTVNYSTDDLHAMQMARGELAQVRDLSTPLIRRLVDFCEAVVL